MIRFGRRGLRGLALAAALPLAAGVATLGMAGTAAADTSKDAYSWHVADALLEDPAIGSPPTAIARAANGDTIELDGTGVLDGGAKTASGEGEFTHRAANGSVVASGSFVANNLISFQFYGCGGEGVPDFLCGGLAKLDVTLHPAGTSLALPATLSIDCLIGDKIPSDGEHARHEGIKLNVKDALNFNHTEHSGFTVFIPQ